MTIAYTRIYSENDLDMLVIAAENISHEVARCTDKNPPPGSPDRLLISWAVLQTALRPFTRHRVHVEKTIEKLGGKNGG